MKGYMDLLLGWFFMLIIFVLVNWYLSTRLYFESGISDIAGQTYKMIDAIEFAKLDSQQALKFAVEKTKKELHASDADIQYNDQLQSTFISKLKNYYNPSHDYSDVDVSVTVLSISVDGNFIVASNSFSALSESRQAGITANIAVPLS
ncbi:MAG: hypothetical protein V1944_00285 [Candidatus Aenigmatarchaeota archaeon]